MMAAPGPQLQTVGQQEREAQEGPEPIRCRRPQELSPSRSNQSKGSPDRRKAVPLAACTDYSAGRLLGQR
jgi:hypothetical protein